MGARNQAGPPRAAGTFVAAHCSNWCSRTACKQQQFWLWSISLTAAGRFLERSACIMDLQFEQFRADTRAGNDQGARCLCAWRCTGSERLMLRYGSSCPAALCGDDCSFCICKEVLVIQHHEQDECPIGLCRARSRAWSRSTCSLCPSRNTRL